MRFYTCIILLSVLSISHSANSQELNPRSSHQSWFTSQTEQEDDKSPHRGSGRRDFYQELPDLSPAL